MNTKRLSEKMEKALSDQMNLENLQSHNYLSYGIWASDEGYAGIGNFLFRHAQEERNHSIKFMMYVLNRGGKPAITEMKAPSADPESITDCFNKVFQYQVENSTAIYKLVDMALVEKDWATWNFLQWFVKEQIEEETLAMSMIDKLKIAGGDRASDESLNDLDREFSKMADDAEMARDATAENPG